MATRQAVRARGGAQWLHLGLDVERRLVRITFLGDDGLRRLPAPVADLVDAARIDRASPS